MKLRTRPRNSVRTAQGLEPRGGIGFVQHDIVGESGVEVPGFVPTKNEVLQLVQYWELVTEIIDLTFFQLISGQERDRRNCVFCNFAHRRLDTIKPVDRV